ncbi:hypothetical protein IWGMT90018_55240 [Mycobacterium kiyosense]|nr:hypothetical protein IWGMT90018_55240 [Mycobacterium kiyosense]
MDVTFTSSQQPCPTERRAGYFCLADMGTDFDDFTDRAKAFATQDVSAAAYANRARLREAMQYGGLSVYAGGVVALRRSRRRGAAPHPERPGRLSVS